MFKPGEIQFRTFNVLDSKPDDFSKLIGKVTACVKYMGFNKDSKESEYRVGFAYCSPKERQSNRLVGKFISINRMKSGKGCCFVYLKQKDIDNPTMKGLTNGIKSLIVSEAERKQIRWMKGIQTYQLV
jgi:hypothetical protein